MNDRLYREVAGVLKEAEAVVGGPILADPATCGHASIEPMSQPHHAWCSDCGAELEYVQDEDGGRFELA